MWNPLRKNFLLTHTKAIIESNYINTLLHMVVDNLYMGIVVILGTA